MPHSPDKASKTQWEAIQHAVGFNLVDIAGWVGIGAAATWFWTSKRLDDNPLLPAETPVVWLGHVLNTVGVDHAWAGRTDAWLNAKPTLFWILIAVAILVSGSAITASTGALENIVLLSLLTAISINPVGTTVGLYLAISLALCVAAVATDYCMNRTEHSDSVYISYPGLSFRKWQRGPLTIVMMVVGLPLVLFIVAVSQYRVARSVPGRYGLGYGRQAQEISEKPLSEIPANVALPFIAKAILLLGEEEHREDALRSLVRAQALSANKS